MMANSENFEDFYDRIYQEALDEFDEEFEQEMEDDVEFQARKDGHDGESQECHLTRQQYFAELRRLQVELVRLQEWVVATGYKLVVLFEGRDAAGKGGVIKRITQRLNPRVCKVVALSAPDEREKGQWYFQRYVSHLPTKGEIVLFDRSWYNRAGVERVMGFCTDEEYHQFMKTVPQFEEMVADSGVHIIKYWFSVSDKEQEFRFNCRIHDHLKQWKLSPMDLQSRIHWEDYTEAKEEMFSKTNKKYAQWHVVPANNKRLARLNCISHLLSQVPYEEIETEKVVLPERAHKEDYVRGELPEELVIPQIYT